MGAIGAVVDNLEVWDFESDEALEAWLQQHDAAHPGIWIRLPKTGVRRRSITFEEVLERGLAYGWSESMRRRFDDDAYLQRFTPRRAKGTVSERNRRIVERLEADGRMTEAGRAALGL